MSVKNVPYSKRKPEKVDYSYTIHGGTVAPTGYLKVLCGKSLKHVLTYNRSTFESVLIRARRLAREEQGYVINGAEFCQ